jgi:peptidoglycan hydrolase CwlO-like protein
MLMKAMHTSAVFDYVDNRFDLVVEMIQTQRRDFARRSDLEPIKQDMKTVKAILVDHDQKLEGLTTRVDSLTTKVESLTTKVQGLTTEVKSLREDVNKLTAQMEVVIAQLQILTTAAQS